MDEPVPVLEPVVPQRRRRIGLVVAVLALLAVGVVALWGLFTVVRDAQPLGGDGPRLVVVETDGGIATTDGADETLHVRDVPGWHYRFPAWSPDGTRVAAIGQSGDFVTVDVFDADPAAGGQPTTIYKSDERPAFYLYWAPDSRHVTFLTSEPNPDDIALRIAPADASAPSEIVRAAAPFYWDFVDPSRLILHTGSTGSEAFLGEVDLEGDSLETADILSGLFRAPAIGGDGASRAYVTAASDDPADGDQLVVEARDGSSRQEIPVAGAAAFSFDPTSTTLAFIAPNLATDPPAPIPSGPLRTVDPATGEVRTLLDGNVHRILLVARRAHHRGARPSPGGRWPGPRRGTCVGRSAGFDGLRRDQRRRSRRSRRTRRASASTCRSSTPHRPPSAPSATSGSRSCSRSRWSPTSTSTPGVTDSGRRTTARSCCR